MAASRTGIAALLINYSSEPFQAIIAFCTGVSGHSFFLQSTGTSLYSQEGFFPLDFHKLIPS